LVDAAIKTFDYLKSLAPIEAEILDVLKRVLRSGRLILGPETEAFEREFADFVGARHCIGVNSGTTALHLALRGIGVGPGDEVITVSNTCVPTVAAVGLCGATPDFVDVRDEDLMMDARLISEAVTGRTKCILPVHLWGQSVDIKEFQRIAQHEGLMLVEDCAQAHGTLYEDRHVGTFGKAGCFSFYPTKNLGAFGEAGAVVTDDDVLAGRLRRLRVYGYDDAGCSQEQGMNGRISEMQAAILRVKLRLLPTWLERRREIAVVYGEKIGHPEIMLPYLHDDRKHSFHQYVIRCQDRDGVIDGLGNHGIASGIHYPVPIHCMQAYEDLPSRPLPVTERACNEILSLPVHEALSDEEVERITQVLCDI
jgi:aminotransferase EvaB